MNRFIIAVLVLLSIAGCQRSKESEAARIKAQEDTVMKDAKGGKMDTTAIKALLESYEGFANKYPADTSSAEYLFKAAQFYTAMHKPLKSISLYEKVYHNYKDYHKRDYALFLQGFVYETEVHNMDAARITYQEFIKLYPNDPLTPAAKMSLETLGKSPDQLVREFEAKQSADSAAVSKK